MNFGIKLRELRHAKGMTLQEVADKARIQPTHLSQIELGKLLPPRFEVLDRIASALCLSLSEVFVLQLTGGVERIIDNKWSEGMFETFELFAQALAVDNDYAPNLQKALKRFIKRHS